MSADIPAGHPAGVALGKEVAGRTRVADKPLSVFSAPFALRGRLACVTPTLGISLFPRDGHAADELIRPADSAMYRAEDVGCADFRCHAPSLSEGADPVMASEATLRAATVNGGLVIQYQPQRAVDDFGTGYSSLSYLTRYPIDKLEIDQSFIADVCAGDRAAMAAAIIPPCRALGLRVLAEGVERAEQLAFPRDQGRDEVQGYPCGTPLLAAQFARARRQPAGFACA